MLLRDRLQARLAEMGDSPDYVRLAEEVLAIRRAPEAIARKLIAQALVIEDRRDAWTRVGERVCAGAPDAPGVYVFRDAAGAPLYVGKALHLRRRLRAHFAPRRWLGLRADIARVADVEWQVVGSELEALLREAEWIRDLAPTANVQVGAPSLDARAIPRTVIRDVIIVLPSSDARSVELVAAHIEGPTMISRTARDASEVAAATRQLWTFFKGGRAVPPGRAPGTEADGALSPIVFSWLAGRGLAATRVEIEALRSAAALRGWLAALLGARDLFAERLIFRRD